MESIAIDVLRDKLIEIDKGLDGCNKHGDSFKMLRHIRTELNSAITILERCGGKMTKQEFGQLTIPDVMLLRCYVCDGVGLMPHDHMLGCNCCGGKGQRKV